MHHRQLNVILTAALLLLGALLLCPYFGLWSGFPRPTLLDDPDADLATEQASAPEARSDSSPVKARLSEIDRMLERSYGHNK